MKFLIDECLSPALAKVARERGYPESTHVVWIGQAGAKDWQLMRVIVEADWTLVTKNSRDFRGAADNPGSGGLYADAALHAGLVCLNGPSGMDLAMQIDLFTQALGELEDLADLVNQVLEVTLTEDDEFHILRYALPA